MKLASIVSKAALDYASSANALEMAGYRVTDWSFNSERQIEVEVQNIESLKKKRLVFRIYPGHPGSNTKGLYWCEWLGKFLEVPEVGE